MVCIIDDREDVWQGCGNLVQVKPYNYFGHTGDIHAPPGMDNRSPSQEPTDFQDDQDKENKGVMTVHEVCKENKNDDNEENRESTKAAAAVEAKRDEDIKEAGNSELQGPKYLSENSDIKSIESEENLKSLDNSAAESNNQTKNKVEAEASKECEAIDERRKDTDQEMEDVPFGQPGDTDNYLLYLEDILRRIHSEFYEYIDKGKERTPLRDIIPRVRGRVLKDAHITFSGLIPNNQKLHQSRPYKVAKAFGAEVTQVRD